MVLIKYPKIVFFLDEAHTIPDLLNDIKKANVKTKSGRIFNKYLGFFDKDPNRNINPNNEDWSKYYRPTPGVLKVKLAKSPVGQRLKQHGISLWPEHGDSPNIDNSNHVYRPSRKLQRVVDNYAKTLNVTKTGKPRQNYDEKKFIIPTNMDTLKSMKRNNIIQGHYNLLNTIKNAK